MIAVAALAREESRGGHSRTDFPRPLPPGRAASSCASTTARGSSAAPCSLKTARNLSSPEPDPCRLSLALMLEAPVRAALLEDLGRAGDLTTDAIVPATSRRGPR